VQFRVSGEHIDLVRRHAHAVEERMRAHPALFNVHLDWEEPSKIVRLQIEQERARALGVSSAQLALFLQGSLSGTPVSTLREDNEQVQILLRGPAEERASLSMLGSLAVPTSRGGTVPLSQIARLEYDFEEGIVWHRNRLPTVTVRADIIDGVQPATAVAELAPQMAELRAKLPSGYLLEAGGSVEDAGRGSRSIAAGMPLFFGVVFTLLMLQLRSVGNSVIVLLTAPLGLIGVTAFLLLLDRPFGFVAMLGTIALAGMIMRNSVILVDQIEHDLGEGASPVEAIVEATVRRFRPIVLTALTAILAMIPLSRSDFFGPMAVAIMGGLLVATALTLLFLPALYAAWHRTPRAGAPA
jgi:multidrug efflux pump